MNKKRIVIGISILSLVSLINGCNKNNTSMDIEENTIEDKIIIDDVEELLDVIETSNLCEDTLSYDTIKEFEHIDKMVFQNKYSDIDGIFTFRGNSLRNSPSFGEIDINENKLQILWEIRTSVSSWGGGAGWTGQPSIVNWPKELRSSMNIYDEFKEKENFVEVIYGSLDGNIYFLDLNTGKKSRDTINVGNPIKGSLSIDPRGLPLLYVGEGIPEKAQVGFNIYSLIDATLLYELNGKDPNASRGWPAFDSSSIVNRQTDSVVVGGENGILYNIKLNSNHNKENNSISINPEVNRYKFNSKINQGRIGIENSVATFANLAYFADNGGVIQCVNLETLSPVWSIDGFDDIDATLTIDIENNKPYIYCGNEVDHQGKKGVSKIKKIDGLSGEVCWEKEFECESLIGEKAVNGGLMATNVVGKKDLEDISIFSLARYKGFNKGGVIALNKDNGEVVWETLFDNYMWSSPVDVYNKEGNGFIVQCDSAGNIHLLDGKRGNILDSLLLNGNIESSPAVYNDIAVVATRNGSIYGIKIK